MKPFPPLCRAAALAVLVLPGPTAAAPDLEGGVFLEHAMVDARIMDLRRSETGGLFDEAIAGKGTSVAGWFNGRTVIPTMSFPDPVADTRPDLLTRQELESGLDQWWNDGDGTLPTEAELAEFDRIVGLLLAVRFYSIASPLAQEMRKDGYSLPQIQRALVYQPVSGPPDFSYRGMVFGAAAARAGMSLARAAQNVAQGLGCDSAKAREYLTKDYGRVRLTTWVQKKAPLSGADLPNVRGDYGDAAKYRKFVQEIDAYRAFSASGAIEAGLHPGTRERVPLPEPFDPGALDSQDTTLLRDSNMEVYTLCERIPAGGEPVLPALSARNFFYVENYRKVTQVDLKFTGSLAAQTVAATRNVGGSLASPNVLPYDDREGGSAKVELPDSAQVNAAFKAIVELGDGLNGYVRYHSKVHDRDVLLYWIPPAKVPGGMVTRWGTAFRGPGIGPVSGEEPSLIEELASEDAGIEWINPPDSMRGWLDPLLFDPATGEPLRPQVANALIKEAFERGPKPFGEYSPYAICNTQNGQIMKIPLQFDLAATAQQQESGVFKAGDVVLAQNYTQKSPVSFLYASINASGIPDEKLPRDVRGNPIKPNGEGLYLEASSCCGITSIVGGTTITKTDTIRPNGQLRLTEQGSGEQEVAFKSPVAITAGVPNDPAGALDPVGEYNLLFPLSRVHPDLPALAPGTGTNQGTDAKLYGDYANNAPVLAHAPDHPDAAYRLPERSAGNPVDALGFPFMSLHGPAAPDDPMHQGYRQGHRYEVTISAWDNAAPLVVDPMPDRGIPGWVCYPIRKLHYRLTQGGKEVFEGDVIPTEEAGSACIATPPIVTLSWVPRADGPHFWEVDIEDVEGNTRKLVSQVNVIEEDIQHRRIEGHGGRSGD